MNLLKSIMHILTSILNFHINLCDTVSSTIRNPRMCKKVSLLPGGKRERIGPQKRGSNYPKLPHMISRWLRLCQVCRRLSQHLKKRLFSKNRQYQNITSNRLYALDNHRRMVNQKSHILQKFIIKEGVSQLSFMICTFVYDTVEEPNLEHAT